MLPEPALTFTIPSIHDDVTLECRVYHPQSLSANPHAPLWRKHAAVVAHPYAPLGGCYDDAVVEAVSAVLLRQGFVVGTFNFRGAGNSTGRTSWTSKGERSDYISFTGFLYYYVHYLDPFRPQEAQEPRTLSSSSASITNTTPAFHGTESQPGPAPTLLFCGYSYGAMVTKLLPPFHSALEFFTAPKIASAAADIRLRAQHLAEKQNTILASARAALTDSPASPRRAALGLRVGGDEDKRRSQDHGRRSFSIDAEDRIRKGVADLMQKAKNHQGHHQGHHYKKKKGSQKENVIPVLKEEDVEVEQEKEPDNLPPVTGLTPPRVAYLLISPPVGWATNLMTLNLGGPVSHFFTKRPRSPKTKEKGEADPIGVGVLRDTDINTHQERQKLVENPTLAVYGDSDVFVTVKRFREWASKLQTIPGSKFRAHEVSTAGHFYIEEGTMQRLIDAIKAFSGELLVQKEPIVS